MIVTALTLTATGAALADGGWTTQQIDLVEGWNLVWLDVEPAAAEDQPATVFGPNATSVCSFVPGRAIGDRGAWRNYHASHPAFASGLAHVQGDRGYFVLSSVDETIAVTGRPLRRSRPQSAGAPALFGASALFPEPTFAEYFAIGGAIDRITEVNRFDGLAGLPEDDFESMNVAFTSIAQNVAYWITTDANQKYAGPLRLNTGAGGLQFGKNQYALDMKIEVPLGGATLTIDVLDSATPPAGDATDASGGDTSWLQYRDANGDWQSFTSPLAVTVDPGATSAVVVLRANRKNMAPATLDIDNSLYQALIEVTDDVGHREVIGAGMEVIGETAGTWMGDITLDTVSLNSGLTPPASGTNAAEPMRFGLLLEIPDGGPARILDRICMPVDATYNDDGSVDTYDRFTTFRSVMFPEPIDLDGNLDGSMALAADHPLNPYRHRYNPEHVNGYAITRAIDIAITTEAPDPNPAQGNLFLGDMLNEQTGNNVLVGTYTETISGLRPGVETIVVSGTFRLVRLSEETGLRECPQ